MGILDDIKNSEANDKRMRMERRHPIEDEIIERFVDLLVKRIIKKEYHYDCAYDINEYYINAFLAKVKYRNGKIGFQLMDEQWNWQAGEYTVHSNSDIIRVDTHPFDKLDDEYIRNKLPGMIKEKIGGGCGVRTCRCFELYSVKRKLFSRFNDIVHHGKYSVYVELRWR